MADPKQAFVIASFTDGGTGAKYTAGSIVYMEAGAFANYALAKLVRDPTDADVVVAATWNDGTMAKDMRAFSGVEVQVSGLAPGDTIAVSRSLINSTYAQQNYVSNSFASGDTITADGIYSFGGRGYWKYAKGGAGAAPVVVIRGG